jgi:hypothetical protein
MSTVPAGWYADPSGQPDLQRWWDGTAWTDHVHPTAPVVPATAVAVDTLDPVAAHVPAADVAPVSDVAVAEPAPAGDAPATAAPATSVAATTWPTAGATWRTAGDGAGAATPSGPTARSGTDPLAIVALVAGLLWVFGLGAVAAIVCGGLALKRGATGTNRTLAIVGLVLGVLGLLPLALLALGVGALSIPVFLGQADAASRAQLESDLRNAAIEQEMFFTGSGTYLDDASQLQVDVAPGTILTIVRADDTAFCLEATDGASLVSYDSAAGGLRDGPC